MKGQARLSAVRCMLMQLVNISLKLQMKDKVTPCAFEKAKL